MQAEFRHLTGHREGALEHGVNSALNIARNVEALLCSDDKIEPDEFERYVWKQLQHYSYLKALMWVPKVAHAQRAAVETGTGGLLATALPILERDAKGQWAPAGVREAYYPLCMVEPTTATALRKGYDLSSDPDFKQVMGRACAEGRPLALSVPADSPSIESYWIFYPVFADQSPTRDVAGFVVEVIYPPTLLLSILEDWRVTGIITVIEDTTDPDHPRPVLRLLDGAKNFELLAPAPPPDAEEKYSLKSNLDLLGRRWSFLCEPTRAYINARVGPVNWMIPSAVMAISILLALYLRGWGRHTAAVEDLVAERTRQLSELNATLACDVESRKRMEGQLVASEARFHAILSSLHESMVLLFDRTGNILNAWIPPEISERLCLDSTHFTGRNLADVLPKELAAKRIERIGQVFDTAAAVRDEYSVLQPHGPAWLESSLSPLRGAEGRVISVVAFVRDVTERHQRNEEINKFKTIADTANYGIAVADMTGCFRYVNEAYARMHGYEPEDLIGKPVQILHPPSQAEQIRQIGERLLREGKLDTIEMERLRKDGSVFHALINGAIVRDQDGNPILQSATVLDVSQLKEAKEALLRRDAILAAVSFAAEHYLSSYDWEATTREVLTRIGEAAHVCRAYIFENHLAPDGELLTSQRMEWVAKGVSSQIGNPDLQGLRVRDVSLSRWLDQMEVRGIFQANVADLSDRDRQVLRGQQIQSLLLVPIYTGKQWWGFIGFDDCVRERRWDAVETEALKAAADIMGAFLLRRQAEREAEAQAAEVRRILEHVPAMLWKFDVASFRLVSVSEALPLLYGYRREDLEDIRKFLSPLDKGAESKAALRAAMEAVSLGEPFGVEYLFHTKDRGRRWFHTVGRPVHEEGRLFYYGLTSDITERKLKDFDHSRLLEAVIQASEAIVVTDPEGLITHINPAFEQVTGYLYAEVLGRHVNFLESPNQDPKAREELWNTIREGRVWRGLLTNRTKAGDDFEQFVTVSPVRDAMGDIVNYVSVQLDVSRVMQLERRLHEAERMAVIGRTITGVAHHLKNIHGSLKGSAELIDEALERKDIEQVRQVWEISRRSTRRLATLALDLLNYGRLEHLHLRQFDLNAMARDVCNSGGVASPKTKTKIELQLGDGIPGVTGDSEKIYEAVLNLVSNAMDACAEFGHGTVQVRTDWSPDEKTVRISVSDSGAGIAPEALARVFDPFYTTKGNKGNGLGLAIVDKIVHAHGGRVTAESQPGRTVFAISLPIAGPAANGERQA